MLLTWHNIRYYQRLMQGLRDAIRDERLEEFAAEFYRKQAEGISQRLVKMENCENQSVEEVVGTFAEENRQAGLRVLLPAVPVPAMIPSMWKRRIISVNR